MTSADKKYFPWEGKNAVFEHVEKAKDAYGNELNLYEGTYQMIKVNFEVMIKKDLDIQIESYNLLRNFGHDNAIRLLDFYYDKKGNGCLVIPKVDTTFELWFNNGGGSLELFDQAGHMTDLFKNLIIGLCSLFDSLNKKLFIIEKFDLDDLFINLKSKKLCVLLARVKKVKAMSIANEARNWDHVRTFIKWCVDKCNLQKDSLRDSFIDYIGKDHYELSNLKDYPQDWDTTKKGEYLVSLVAGDHTKIRRQLGFAKITWPFLSEGSMAHANLPSLVLEIIDSEGLQGRFYETSDRMSYIILLRNLYKHYKKLPEHIKAILSDRNALIETIEQWTPGIWIKIYEFVGWP